MNKLFFISNDYRKSRIAGFIKANCFGDFKLMSNIAPVKQKIRPIKKMYYNIKLLLSDFIIVSDVGGINYLDNFTGLKHKNINLLMWNSEKELSALNINDLKLKYTNLKICFFFKDAAKNAKALYNVNTQYLMSPVIPYTFKQNVTNKIVYCSEVNISSTLAISSPELDKQLWIYSDKIVNEGSYLLYKQDLITDFFKAFTINIDLNWILKNRVRYIYAKKLKEVFKEKFTLVGTDWLTLGFEAIPSEYDMEELCNLYAGSKVCIDLLSKSSNEALFERVMQIVSASDGLLQLKTSDSEEAYGAYCNERTFDTFTDLVTKINIAFSLNESTFKEKGENFRQFIKQKSSSFI